MSVLLRNASTCILEHRKLAVVLALGAYGLWYCYRPRGMPPGPWGYPLVGSKFSLGGEDHVIFAGLKEMYGDVFTLWLGGNKYFVVLNSYEAAKEALVTCGSTYADIDVWEGSWLLGMRDDITSACYAAANVNRHCTISALRKSGLADGRWNRTMGTEVDELAAVLSRNEGTPINMEELFLTATAKHQCQILFGRRDMENDPDNKDLVHTLDDWFSNVPGVLFARRTPYPFKHMLDLIIPWKSRVTAMPALLVVEHEVKRHLANYDRTRVCSNVCDIFISRGQVDTKGIRQVADNLLVLLPDAILTVSNLLTWLIVYLIRYPEYQDQLYDEIRSIVGDSGKQRVLLEDKVHMPMTRGFMEEVLRVTSIFPLSFGQTALLDTKFRGYHIPKKTPFYVNFFAINHDPERFQDPYEFRPERFIRGNEDTVPAMTAMVFSIGRRSCIGEALARSLMFFFLTNLVKDFRFDLAPGENLPSPNEGKSKVTRVATPFKVVAQRRTSTCCVNEAAI